MYFRNPPLIAGTGAGTDWSALVAEAAESAAQSIANEKAKAETRRRLRSIGPAKGVCSFCPSAAWRQAFKSRSKPVPAVVSV